jgi:hypothetical protein
MDDHCIRFMQDHLQVEHVFRREMVRDGGVTQFTLNLAKLDRNLTATKSCVNCDTAGMIATVAPLVDKMAALDQSAAGGAEGSRQPATSGANAGSGPIEWVTPALSGATESGRVQRVTPEVTGDRTSTAAVLALDSDPTGAEVYLGDFFSGTTPYQNLGLKSDQDIRITLKKPEYRDRMIELRLSGGRNNLGVVQLIPAFGNLEITSDPAGAEVLITGKKSGSPPTRKNG